ncbi:protein TASOR [Gastrophryne carolinensis]
MEEEKRDGAAAASHKSANEESRALASNAQNGEQALAEEAEKGGLGRRYSSGGSNEPVKIEGGWKGVIPPEEPLRKRFQIPRKSRDKKALQTINTDSREFEDILKILHSSFLDSNSKIHFAYKAARLVHNEFLEKEFTEKRRQLKYEGRQEKELAESYAFLLVDESQVNTICEKGLLVGHSKITTLGKPFMGVYLSRYADLLQANPLEAGATGMIFIFKVFKGKMKLVFDNFRSNQDSYSGNSSMDPAPKHECHVLKNMNSISSLLSYRAFERTQYYFYEYGFDEILKRPRHVCPYAVVTFGYKTDQKPRPLPAGSVGFISERYNDRSSFIMWRGQFLCNGKLLCFASLKSTNGPFFPYKLPEKLDLEVFIRLEEVKKTIPPLLFYKETHMKAREVVKGGIFSRLYEVCDKTRTGNDFQGLVQKLEKENLALVKKMPDRGFLFFYFPTPMTSSYGSQSSKHYPLHALFVYQESRAILQPAPHFKAQPTITVENHEIIPELMTVVAALHYALFKAQSDTSDNFNVVVEKHVRLYLKRRAEGSYKHREFALKDYEQHLDTRKNLYVAPRDKGGIYTVLKSYLLGSDAYTLLVTGVKELLQENKKVQQFSPISDYEPVEVEHDAPASKNQDKDEKPPDNADYDPDKVHRLLSLIQQRKNASSNQETDEASHSGVKRKLEDSPETKWKHPKYEDYFHGSRDEPVDSLITALGGQDTDLREEEEEEPEPEQSQAGSADVEYCKGLFEKLTNSGLLDSIKQFLPSQNASNDETSNTVASVSADTELPVAYDQSTYVKPQTDDHPDTYSAARPPPPANEIVAQKADDGSDPLAMEEIIQGPYTGYASPCPSTPTEEISQEQGSNSSNEESQMNWKLIPITGEEGRVPEDHVGYLRDENQQGLNLAEEHSVFTPRTDPLSNDPRMHKVKQRSSGYSPLEEYQKRRRRSSQMERAPHNDHTARKGRGFFKTKHCQEGVIENTVLEIYSNFSERLRDVLREKDISYTAVAAPVLSSDDRPVRLSEWLSTQSSGIYVQEFVDELRFKLDDVVRSSLGDPEVDKPVYVEPEIRESTEYLQHLNRLKRSREPNCSKDINPQISELIRNGCIEPDRSRQDTAWGGSPVPLAEPVPQTALDTEMQDQENSAPQSPNDVEAPHTGLAQLINQMNPDVFTNLVKIFTHVNKNIVNFYIHTEQEENEVSTEIKDYLVKLGNVQCSPKEFLNCSSDSDDKLLIIIQNEEIASSIHTIPSLVTLKTKSCVSFAGVDNLDDLKNHTYNELFMSGGIIVSDDTVLNPDTVTDDTLKKFLMFLEEIDNPDGKWQWKIHCKFQKKLKELARVNKTALNILNLLNTYQKKHLVEILAYHNCDSQSRQAPELDCLIKLQVQNILQRHLVFLTEKSISLFPNHTENGIVVTKMEEFIQNFTALVGHHNSSGEEHCLSQLVNQEKQTVVSEADVKEEEDMSLDSEDELPQIEVCTNNVDAEPCRDEALNQTQAVKDPEIETSKNQTLIIDPDCMQPVTPGSTSGSATGEHVAENSLNSLSDYDKQLGISPFNLLTHQTFLGSMVYGTQTPVDNFFTNTYNQSVEQETSTQTEWDPKWNGK